MGLRIAVAVPAAVGPLSAHQEFGQPARAVIDDAAYKTIMQCAMLGLWANGYRTSTSQPGHHQTALQALPKTLGVAQDAVIVLDALRRQRNLNDYEGAPITDVAVAECLAKASALLTHTRQWLQDHRPDLMSRK